MGVIDKATYTAKCQCGEFESVTLLEHGSAYGGSWQPSMPMTCFKITWSADGFGTPRITSARCKKCGGVPEITVT